MIELCRIDEARNMRRFYRLDNESDPEFDSCAKAAAWIL